MDAQQQDINDREQAMYLLKHDGILEQINDIAKSVEAGWNDPLEAYIILKRIAQAASTAMDVIKDSAIEEAQEHGKEFEYKGVKVAVRNSGSRWDYSSVSKIGELTERLKSYQQLSKQAAAEAKHGKKIYDDEGLEVEAAEHNEGKTNIFISL